MWFGYDDSDLPFDALRGVARVFEFASRVTEAMPVEHQRNVIRVVVDAIEPFLVALATDPDPAWRELLKGRKVQITVPEESPEKYDFDWLAGKWIDALVEMETASRAEESGDGPAGEFSSSAAAGATNHGSGKEENLVDDRLAERDGGTLGLNDQDGGCSDDFVGGGASDDLGDRLTIEDALGFDDEVKNFVSDNLKLIGQDRNALAHFLQGMAQGLKAIGGQNLDRR